MADQDNIPTGNNPVTPEINATPGPTPPEYHPLESEHAPNLDLTAPEAEEPKASPRHRSRGWRLLVPLSIVVTLMAWFAMVKDEYLSFWTGVVGAVVSLAATILVGKGIWRDLAITCLIACGVLILVYVIFYTAINYAINAI